MRKFRNDVRSRRRDEQKIGAVREFDVARSPVFLFVVEAGRHRILRKRL